MTGEGEFLAGLESLRRLVALAISPSLCAPQGAPFDDAFQKRTAMRYEDFEALVARK